MRNSTREHNQRTPSSPWLAARWVLLVVLYPFALPGSGEFTLNREDMVAIRADQAWEDVVPETIHFDGHFEMHIRNWQVTADQATLYGKLDDPRRLELRGAPAHFEVSHLLGNRAETVRGEAQEIVYEREYRSIRFSGDARLIQGENELRSSTIEYDIETDRFRAEGEAGVQIKAETDAPGS